jgi:hypothetical protein
MNKDIEFLLKHSLGYSPSKLNEVASRCYKEKKYKSALLLFEQSAIRDDMNSQYALANMFVFASRMRRVWRTSYALYGTILGKEDVF